MQQPDSTLISNISGTFVNVNSSGQLAVDAVVSVGATTVHVSGETLHLAALEVSGTFPNAYVTQSGAPVSGIPHRLVIAFSGDVAIAKISGETVVTSVSGNVVNTKISGETIRLISGHNDVTMWAFDPSGLRYNQIWVENSGGHRLQAEIAAGSLSVAISGNVVSVSGGAAKVSGETVAIWQGSGRNGVFISNQSGNLFLNIDASGRLAVSDSGTSVNVLSGQVQVMSGIVVSKISGETIRLVSGHNTVAIQGFDYSGLTWNSLGVDTSGGTALKIAGNLTAQTDVSGQLVYSVLHVSGNPPLALASITTTSGAALLTMQATKAVFKSYQSLPVTNDSGGTQLLSGQSTVVSIKNLGITGSFMWVGSSGTGNWPWASGTDQSGLGWFLGPRDSVTIPIFNPNLLWVCVGPTNRSGQRISYMISADL